MIKTSFRSDSAPALLAGMLALSAFAPTALANGSGTLTDSSGPLNYDAGPFVVANPTPDPAGGELSAVCNSAIFVPLPSQVSTCDVYQATVNVSQEYLDAHPGLHVRFTMSWVDTADSTPAGPNPVGLGVSDYDLYIRNGKSNELDGLSQADAQSASGADPEIASFRAKAGSNVYSAFIVPYTPSGETVHLKVELTAGAAAANTLYSGPDAAAPEKPRYQVFAPAPNLENSGQQNGEFNIGFNPKSGNIMAFSITFSSSLTGLVYRLTPPEKLDPPMPASGDAEWKDVSSLWGSVPQPVGDPILWTDQDTGRTFETNMVQGPNLYYAFSDDDGETWTNAGISGIAGADHETIGTGPYPAGSPFELVAEANGYVGADGKGRAVYYCSQDVAGSKIPGDATGAPVPAGSPAWLPPNSCVRSDDGGLTWGPIQIASDGRVCGKTHGHVHVAPDGTVYLPNRGCVPTQGGVYSNDAGLTWQPFNVPAAERQAPVNSLIGSDPSVAIDAKNKLYFCYVNRDGHAHVTVGQRDAATNVIHWGTDTDIGISHGIVNAVFTEAVGGDEGRAACGFLGTEEPGNYESLDFPGVWYLYIASTYDGGATWTTVNATPNDPVQGAGGIWQEGGSNSNRNLLDFNEITLDDKGRVLFGYDDGCVSVACIADPTYSRPDHEAKEFLAKMRVARQTGGKTLKASADAEFATLRVPGAPSLKGTADTDGLVLSWKVPDHGGSEITGYTVTRTPTGATGTSKTFTTTTKTSVVDLDTHDGSGYSYVVTATNAQGTGAPSNAFAPSGSTGPQESACSTPGITVVTDAAGDSLDGLPGHDALAVHIAEPYVASEGDKFVISLDIDDVSSPQTNAIYFVNFTLSDGVQYYVAYDTTLPPGGASDPASAVFNPFIYGHHGGTGAFTNTDGDADAGSGIDTAHKRIVWVLSKSKIPAFATSSVLQKVQADVRLLVGTLDSGSYVSTDSSATIDYRPVGNLSCAPNTAPVATLAANPASGNAPLDVTFTVGAHDPDAIDTVTYDLAFGDGAHASGTGDGTQTHTYAAGNWNAVLTVTDSRGKKSISAASVSVSQQTLSAPTVTLSPSSSSVAVGKPVTLTWSSTNATSCAAGGDWSGSKALSGTEDVVVSKVGANNYLLRCTGEGGNDAQAVTVTGRDLSVALSSDVHGGDVTNQSLLVHFAATVADDDGTPLQYSFAFGDGETSVVTQSGATVTHEYKYAGTYHPYVVVTEDYGSKSASSGANDDIITTTVSVPVDATAEAHLTYSLPNGDVAPVDVAFDTSGSTGDSYSLDFGDSDGHVQTVQGLPPQQLTHRYPAPGTYDVTLTMMDGHGGSSVQAQRIVISAQQGLVAQLQVTPTQGVSPLDVVLDGCMSIPANDGTSIVSFTMDFGDGTAPQTKTVDATHVVDCNAADRSNDPSRFTHRYTVNTSTTFYPTLTVTDSSTSPRTAQAKSLGVAVAPAAAGMPAPVVHHGGGSLGFLTLLPLFAAGLRRRRTLH